MEIISGILLTFFIISAVLIIFLIVIQDDQGDSIGGLFTSGTSPFRSKSGNLLQRITAVVAFFFFISAFGYALLTKPRDPFDSMTISAEEGVFLKDTLNLESTSDTMESVSNTQEVEENSKP